jgi:hypothetical protein
MAHPKAPSGALPGGAAGHAGKKHLEAVDQSGIISFYRQRE